MPWSNTEKNVGNISAKMLINIRYKELKIMPTQIQHTVPWSNQKYSFYNVGSCFSAK